MNAAPACVILYTGGVLTEEQCECGVMDEEKGYPAYTHAVTIVGYENSKTVKGCSGWWIVKNSWGPYWGENGYGRFCIPEKEPKDKPRGTCNLNFLVMIPHIDIVP